MCLRLGVPRIDIGCAYGLPGGGVEPASRPAGKLEKLGLPGLPEPATVQCSGGVGVDGDGIDGKSKNSSSFISAQSHSVHPSKVTVAAHVPRHVNRHLPMSLRSPVGE